MISANDGAVLRVKASRRFGTLSPLRYPGGKSSLAGLFQDLIGVTQIRGAKYVEPYAGGAGAGIALLREGVVQHLVINDIDPAVYAFWMAITTQNRKFVAQVRSIQLNVDEWRRQRDIYRAASSADLFDLGFSFFYLNRTNRSGILHAGVIGGNDQAGNYKIDARFNRETLVDRITAIGRLADQITVSNLDGRTVIKNYERFKSVFMYIDPPYVEAGSQLYLNSFDHRDHSALADVVNKVKSASWLMTYDMSPLVSKLYQNQFQCKLALTYSARYPGPASELLIASPRTEMGLKKLSETKSSVALV